ncbi:hypothetical protein [Victivallis vadensis]|uniref:hypothetical protein n=1 Tax=Victivallis vadensis TaxID=172901 RepID=UPI003D008142
MSNKRFENATDYIKNGKRFLQKALERNFSTIKSKEEAIELFSMMKFNREAILPYGGNDGEELPTNFMEFINQLYTTAISYKAVEWLNEEYKGSITEFSLCLGESNGRDLTVFLKDNTHVIAEVFAVTHPDSNQKLKHDLLALSAGQSEHGVNSIRYAFFALPEEKFKCFDEGRAEKAVTYTPKMKDAKPIKYAEDFFKNETSIQWKCCIGGKSITCVCFSQSEIDKYIMQL